MPKPLFPYRKSSLFISQAIFIQCLACNGGKSTTSDDTMTVYEHDTDREDSGIDATDQEIPEPETISSYIPISGSKEALQETLATGIHKLQSINGHRWLQQQSSQLEYIDESQSSPTSLSAITYFDRHYRFH